MKNQKTLTPDQLEDAKRLKAIYEAKKKTLGLTQQSIADELNASQGAVGHYLNGRNALNTKAAAVFAKMLNISISDFSPTLAKEAQQMASSLDANVKNPIPYARGNLYPVISWVSAGAWADACEPYTLDDIDEWFESDATVFGSGFWLRVQGDSMTAPSGISIPEGTLVLIDTGRDPVNGSLVIAKLTDANEATFKKLIIDGGAKYLKGLNPAWPLVPINGNCKIIGVAIETKLRLV
ncbi:MAG: LexA family transcriptional regulator [Hafnia sp.]|jgi:SOS-response transcriptional repressor LexA|uniref:SOS-response transcriptional repressor LexA (RecA-mediated autopeptidase) n=1 Tax=Hafnia alvei TaxID=569 RepID=A0A1C6Z174_HAFAL|nr:LexA family transcriptional regulator [Hafnia alvei]NLS54041.1 helix-turn-helix domain-containing protein [Hafnia alvei]WNN50834.1 LexA family transcriptional regulator [Hafnia alvei]SCM52788.1 SOS-response transcriptional repressor LexA (RecA-mediated autopeptidase) [Hafnia alvei]